MNKSQQIKVWIIACLVYLWPCTYKKIGGDVRLLNKEMMKLQKDWLVFKRAKKPSVWEVPEYADCMWIASMGLLTKWQRVKLRRKMFTNR
jgi:hypothetical protein